VNSLTCFSVDSLIIPTLEPYTIWAFKLWLQSHTFIPENFQISSTYVDFFLSCNLVLIFHKYIFCLSITQSYSNHDSYRNFRSLLDIPNSSLSVYKIPLTTSPTLSNQSILTLPYLPGEIKLKLIISPATIWHD
jgi:hypothetical protein